MIVNNTHYISASDATTSSGIERRGRRSPEETFAILGHETRLAILHERWDAYDPAETEYDTLSSNGPRDHREQTVVSEDPLATEVTVVIDDDRLTATLDGEGVVTDVRT